MSSVHWTWTRQQATDGGQIVISKKDALSRSALQAAANLRCQQCHVSVPKIAAPGETASAQVVDCLVCHDSTGAYRRDKPWERQDLLAIARLVARPEARNCLTCHFRNCDLEPDSADNALQLAHNDVHLRNGLMTCQQCHVSNGVHQFSRQPGNEQVDSGCVFCHQAAPHSISQLNEHSETLACRSCHIPLLNGGKASLVEWNWILSGFQKNGFLLSDNQSPVYRWDSGIEKFYQRGDRINPDQLTFLQQPVPRNRISKISPFQRVYTTQPYDLKYRYLLSPRLTTSGQDILPEGGWLKTLQQGMQDVRLPFSGEYGFTVTASYRRLTHGVAPASDALDCLDCHGSRGRIEWKELGYTYDPWDDAAKAATPVALPMDESAAAEPSPQVQHIEETPLSPETIPAPALEQLPQAGQNAPESVTAPAPGNEPGPHDAAIGRQPLPVLPALPGN